LSSHLRFEIGAEDVDGMTSSRLLIPGREYTVVVDGYSIESGQFGLNLSLQNERTTGPAPSPPPSLDPTLAPPSTPPTSRPTATPPSPPTSRPTSPPTNEDDYEDYDDDMETICYALEILDRDFACNLGGIVIQPGAVCETIQFVDIEYSCGLSESVTDPPTLAPPTVDPTLAPSPAPETTSAVAVQFRVGNNAQFSTDAPLYLILVGNNGVESEPIDLGLVIARTEHSVEAVVEASGVGLLHAVRFCVDIAETGRTRVKRSGFKVVFDGVEYDFERSRGQGGVITRDHCWEEAVFS